jgi:hypothetical protein
VRALARSLERRIEACLPKALRIIRPEQSCVEACGSAVADAICHLVVTEQWPNSRTISDQMRAVERDLATIDPELASEQRALRTKVVEALDVHGSRNDPPPDAELIPRRKRRKTTKAAEQKLRAVALAVDLMDDFSEPTMPGATVKSRHAALAKLLHEAATGDAASDLRHQVRAYHKEMVAPTLDQVRNRAGQWRSRRRDQRWR